MAVNQKKVSRANKGRVGIRMSTDRYGRQRQGPGHFRLHPVTTTGPAVGPYYIKTFYNSLKNQILAPICQNFFLLVLCRFHSVLENLYII